MGRAGRRAVTTAAALGLVVLAGACNSDRDGSVDPGSTSSASADHAVETQVTWGKVTGTLPPHAREQVIATVGDLVDGWTEAAYLGGDYPRQDFSDAWPGFTPGAAQEAHGDRALTSNEDIGTRIDGVEPHKSTVRVDVLAVKQQPVGITAHVYLGFATTGDLEREVRVKGRLFLTPTPQGWKVFAFDLTKGAAR